MSEYRVSETKLREQQGLARETSRAVQANGHLVWKIIAGAAVGMIALGVITSFSDIKRYIKMTRM